jgi:hypothetical protein
MIGNRLRHLFANPSGLEPHLGDHAQIVGKHPQADPAFQARVAVIAAALQLVPAFGQLIHPSIPARQLRPATNQACCA